MTTTSGGQESVMQGGGAYGANSRPQHVAAAVAYPYLEAAAADVPLDPARTVVIGDLGCAGGANEMEPMRRAIDVLRRRDASTPIEVVHTDLPQNDFGPLFELLDTPASYTSGSAEVYPRVVGQTLYGPLFPAGSLSLAWSGITLHWISAMPSITATTVYANLTTGADRAALQAQSQADLQVFLESRARELVAGGEVVTVAGTSAADGLSGAEDLFTVIDDTFAAMVADGVLRPEERTRIFYPTWNRTPSEWLAPFDGPLGAAFEVVAHRVDASRDDAVYPQYVHGRDAQAFGAAYVSFVRAVTEHPFFRSLDADRTSEEHEAIREEFYRRLQAALATHPTCAAVWHVMSLRIRRRPG
jgi:hypothetical protein